jgi:serine/threonine protein kinase
MPGPHEREQALFLLALGKSPNERAAWLDRECGSDLDLRARLDLLLAAHDQPDSKLDSPIEAIRATIALKLPNDPMAEAVGQTIGRYKLLEKIGEGGCGVVYVAEQTEPVRRRVALKVIKLGMDTKEVIARFEAERQALAMMDHPNIAKVLDAGATETGRPYFVMELVRGIRITEYCDQNQVSTTERLDLFIKVCHAIQHAHQKGIIHRDIKPSNIMVTLHDGVPVPKVIDFGIAKATQGRLTDATVYTQLHQFIGTPAYMSPEQAEMSGLDVDTRSDIYSLGVLLYELLTGRTPFDAQELVKSGLDAIRRTIREVEPPRPSTRLSTLKGDALTATAKKHGTASMPLLNLIRGDLDCIVMKCLEKDRTHRYETANGVAMDLKRCLENEPITARPPSRAYRFQKAWRRNKGVFAGAALIAVVLLVATGISTWQAVRANRAEKLAKERLADSEAISKFLTEVFQSPNPARDGRTITVAESLASAAKKLESDLGKQPAQQAKLEAVLANTYDGLGLYREAIPLQEKVCDYYVSAFGPEHPNTLPMMDWLGNFYEEAGRRNEALKLREQALPIGLKVNGMEHPETLFEMANLANSYDDAGRREEALKLREQTLALSKKVNGPEDPSTLMAMNNLARSYDEAGRGEKALSLWESLLALNRKVNGPEHPRTIGAMETLASSYHNVGRRAQALNLMEDTLALSKKVNGPEHVNTMRVMIDLATCYDDAGRFDEAIQIGSEMLTRSRTVNGPEHPITLIAMNNLANSYNLAGRSDEAIKLAEELLPLFRKVNGPAHPDTLIVMDTLSDCYIAAGRGPEAFALLAKTIELDPQNIWAYFKRATWQAWFGEDADYEATRSRLVQLADGTDKDTDADRVAKAACLRPSTNAALLAQALELAQRSVEIGKTNSSDSLPWHQLALGLAEYRNGHYADAEQSLALAEQTAGEKHDIPGTARLYRAMSLFRQNKPEEARKLFSQAAAQIPPLPKDENKPLVNGKPVSIDVMICWLAYKEAKNVLAEPRPEH